MTDIDLTKLTAKDVCWWMEEVICDLSLEQKDEIRRRLELVEKLQHAARKAAIDIVLLRERLEQCEDEMRKLKDRMAWDAEGRRLTEERLEQCEAALKHLAAITVEDCSCHSDFKDRRLRDPSCSYHQYKHVFDAARAALEEK